MTETQTVENEIRALVETETRAWDTRDAELLVGLFHPDAVWPWPPNPSAHDPVEWTWGMGRFDPVRWRRIWQELFDTHELVHNRRSIVRISVSPEGDGAFAVVDVDTLWRRRSDGERFHWLGRACKAYTKIGDQWKLIMHTGLLSYPPPAGAPQTTEGGEAELLPLPDPPLHDGRIVLRPWIERDLVAANRATQDPQIARFTGVPEAPTLEQTREFFGAQPALRQQGAELTLAIADAATDEFLGTISLLRFEWAARRAEIGYWVAPWARGQGVATAAARLLSRWALERLNLVRLALHTHTDNRASQQVAERAGFTREGTLRSFDARGDRPRDIVVYSLTPEDLAPATER